MRRFALLSAWVLCLVVFGLPGTSAAHEPGTWWSCFGGEPVNGDTDAERDGNCWMHWNNAERGWHFIGTDDWPDGSRAVIRSARLAWTDGHALNAPEDSNWDNHVRWNGACNVACAVSTGRDASQEHLVSFRLHFDSGFNFNLNDNLGHGEFGRLDLKMVATHEWGHTMGFGHSARAFGHDCSSRDNVNSDWATMTQGDCLYGGHTEQRSLNDSDRRARCNVYWHGGTPNHEFWCGTNGDH